MERLGVKIMQEKGGAFKTRGEGVAVACETKECVSVGEQRDKLKKRTSRTVSGSNQLQEREP